MLVAQLFGEDWHFALNLLAGLVCLATVWLYFDSWLSRRESKELLKWLGFLLLAGSFFIHATVLDQTTLGQSIFGATADRFSELVRLVGYLILIIGQIIDPLQRRPDAQGLKLSEKSTDSRVRHLIVWLPIALTSLTGFGLPLASLVVGVLYWRRATTGLERHLKPVATAFWMLAAFELMTGGRVWQTSSNIVVARLVAPLGPIWYLSHLLLLAAIFLIGRWVWQYLIRRLQSQLTMIFTVSVTVIFLVVTVSFTYLLLTNIAQESLTNLSTAANVLNYALDSKRSETLSHAQALAENSQLAGAVATNDRNGLLAVTKDFLTTKKESSLIITNADGQVQFRAEDPDRWGDALNDDPLIRRSLIGQSNSNVSVRADVLAPVVEISSAVPIRQNNLVIGIIKVGLAIDNSLVDGIKRTTGLDSAVYAGNIRSATTLVAADNKSRLVGIKEETPLVKQTVLEQRNEYKGKLTILNTAYLAVFEPVKDVDNEVIGMLFVGKPELSILQTAGRSIEISFLVAAALLLISLLPAYLIARYIAQQLR